MTNRPTCSTHATAFAGHGIDDGVDLVSSTHALLAANGHRQLEPSAEFVEQVARAFRVAYIRNAAVPLVPEPISHAIDDAGDALVHRILDEPDADLRTDLLPAFYRTVASTYCAHLEAGGDAGEVGVWFVGGDDPA